jgi:HPt (histidine-containing phosphotransfer) domain-containing protein
MGLAKHEKPLTVCAPNEDGLPTMSPNENKIGSSGENEPPVDLARMTDLTGGETEGLRELVDLYLEQTADQLRQIEAAIRDNKPDDVRREAHSCGGASATLGMMRLGRILKELESQGKAKSLTTATALCAEAHEELSRVREFLTKHFP